MSIILKGIDLPKGGELLTVNIYNGFITVYTVTPNDTVIEHKVEAIQIPKGHGKISDISGLLNEYKERLNSLGFVVNVVRREAYRTVLIDICNDLENAPTILEAESEE